MYSRWLNINLISSAGYKGSRPSIPLGGYYNMYWTQENRILRSEYVTQSHFDGSCITNPRGKADTESGLWYHENDKQNAVLRIDFRNLTHQTGELAGVWLEPPYTMLHLIGDSKFVIQGLMTNLPKWARGFMGVTHHELFKAVVAAIRMRTAPTTFW